MEIKICQGFRNWKIIADELRDQIRKEDGIEPGSTPTVGNSGESKIIKSSNDLLSMCGGGGGGAVGEGGANGGEMKKSLSFGHVEITEIVKITKEDEHKNEGHNSPTVFNGFIEKEKIKINFNPLPASDSED